LIDAMEWDIEPLEDDLPLPYETSIWTSGSQEMQRCCIKRHGKYYVNLCTMDLANKKRTIKEIWRVKWHTEWDMTAPLPNPGWSEYGGNWPMWMQDVPEPAF